MKVEIEQKQYERFVILQELYKQTDGSTLQIVNIAEVAAVKGVKNGRFRDAYQYLSDENLIEGAGAGFSSKLTHEGKKAVEQSVCFPNERTVYFPSYKEMGL